MNVIISNKKVNVKDKDKEMLVKKINKLGKFFPEDIDAHVTVSEQRDDFIVEVTIVYHGLTLRAEVRNPELLTAADSCVAALDRQIRKNKTRLSKRYREGGYENYSVDIEVDVLDEEEDIQIIRTKQVASKPMTTDEAVLQMNMLGHDFFIFNAPETGGVNVVYRRKDGHYGLIETV